MRLVLSPWRVIVPADIELDLKKEESKPTDAASANPRIRSNLDVTSEADAAMQLGSESDLGEQAERHGVAPRPSFVPSIRIISPEIRVQTIEEIDDLRGSGVTAHPRLEGRQSEKRPSSDVQSDDHAPSDPDAKRRTRTREKQVFPR